MRERLQARRRQRHQLRGAAAWQTVFHMHLHVIPRYDDDPLQLPVRPRAAESDELMQVAAELRGD